MIRTFLHTENNGRTADTKSQRKEVLFFAYPHFLFFNFSSDTQVAHLALPSSQADPSQNQKSHFFQRFIKILTLRQ
jgi:hypothetical protein